MFLFFQGEEYVYREEWGEQLVGKHQSCLVVCDIESESISVCPGVPPEYCPGSAVWSPEGHIVGVCVQSTPRRLGLVYCSNRPSFIFQLTLDGSFSELLFSLLHFKINSVSINGSIAHQRHR